MTVLIELSYVSIDFYQVRVCVEVLGAIIFNCCTVDSNTLRFSSTFTNNMHHLSYIFIHIPCTHACQPNQFSLNRSLAKVLR